MTVHDGQGESYPRKYTFQSKKRHLTKYIAGHNVHVLHTW